MAKILYFRSLPNRFGRSAENRTIPPTATIAQELLERLRKRGGPRTQFLIDQRVQVTMNRQKGYAVTPMTDRDEIGIVSR